MPLIPIDQLIKIPEGVPITTEQLAQADLATIPRGVTLLTKLDRLKVLIRQEDGALLIKLVYKVYPDDALVPKYSIKRVARAMEYATGLVPKDPVEMQRLPKITAASWTLPDEVSWNFLLPIKTKGDQLLEAVRVSSKFVLATTVQLLAQQPAS